jgi:phosphoglucomutase/phosphomannomutase
MTDTNTAIAQLSAAVATGKLSQTAGQNVRHWLTEPYLQQYAAEVANQVAAGQWQDLEDAFWTIIPFGTGGRRGRMFPIGCNAINDRTIGESAQGLADYVKQQAATGGLRIPERTQGGAEHRPPLSCAIAYDTRHRSRRFAELCSEIMAAAGFVVYFLDGYRSTPELSFAVRYKHCDCGMMITASHNPPSDNAVKVYGPSGGQFVPPHDKASIQAMQRVTWIQRTPFADALAAGKVVLCQEEVDAAFLQAVRKQSVPGPRNLKILYSPLHGVGASAVLPVLAADGFHDVELFAPHAEPDGDFPNVPNHVANPENPAVFAAIIDRAKQSGAELILATDPDCDRLGCAAPQSTAPGSPWGTLTGNQLGSLLCDFLLGTRLAAGALTPQHYVVKTLVTTELIRRIADRYGVQTAGDLLVGFKWIGNEMDARGPQDFVIGIEESYGFLAGDHVRDKDAAVASMLTAEMAARLKSEGMTLHQRLDELFCRHGCFSEGQVNVQMPGEKGMAEMNALMARVRTAPPGSLGGLEVTRVRDYLNGTVCPSGEGCRAEAAAARSTSRPLAGPRGDMVFLDLEAEGNYVAVRPSGTEPKVKIYLFAYDPPAAGADLEATKTAQAQRLKTMAADFKKFSEA